VRISRALERQFHNAVTKGAQMNDERGRSGQITPAIAEFLSTENAIDLPFLLGLSSIAQKNTHSGDG
jgi:hypothetical protein